MEGKNKKLIFEATSILNDTVIMDEETFRNHIMMRHPEMTGHENEIKETIEKPNLVYKAKRHPDTRKQFVRKTHKNEISEYNNVIVEYDDDNNGHVKTSYYSENLERGGDYVYFKY